MSRGIGRAFAAGVLAAFAGAIWLTLFYGIWPDMRLDFNVTPPASIVTGVYPAEREAGTEHTFAWTAESMTVILPDLDRHVDWLMNARVRGARSGSAPNPELTFFVDGRLVLTHASTVDYEDVQVPIPARPAQRGLALSMRASPTFVPGPRDPRPLGVMLDSLTFTPDGIVLPTRTAVAGVAIASAAIGIAVALLGVTAGTAVGTAVLMSAILAAFIARGFGPYTDYPHDVAQASVWVALLAGVLTGTVRAMRGEPFRNTAKFAIALSTAALLIELAILLHPAMPIGDALFHAHRFQEVLAGHFYFTSIAPGNYRFPYAPGLYVVAMPFAGLVRRGASDMMLLRTIVCAADAVAGLLLYGMVVQMRGDRLAGALAVGLYHLIPLSFGVITVGNLTNAFAQSLAVVALAVIASSALRFERRGLVLALTLVLTATFLSHTSAFAIVSVAGVLIAGMFWWRGGPALRSPALAVLVGAILASAIAVAVYYAHFLDTYRTELARIGSETASASPDAGGRGIVERLSSVPRYLTLYFGVPALVLAAWGAVLLWQRRARDRVTLSAIGWGGACLLFLLLGIVTPVDMRYYLASIPIVALMAAVGASLAWQARGAQRVVVSIMLGWVIVIAARAWWGALG
jgi:hypothetical protein